MSKPVSALVRIAQIFMLSLALSALLPAIAFAATTIEPSGDETGSADTAAIQNALDNDDNVVLKSGATYYTNANLKVRSGNTVTATGATIVSVKEGSGGFRSTVSDGHYNYDSCKNVTVTGGYWKHVNPNGFQATMIQFTHASNITLKDLTVEGSFNHHAIEFIACKNVNLQGCTVKSIGEGKSNSVEEAVQFDVATPDTAPTILKAYGEKAVSGQTCQNITVNKCKILGSRGLSTNRTKKAPYANRCHKNVTITNCTIIGTTSEAVALFNAVGKLNVKNNTIVSYSPRKSTAYSVGLHFALFGKVAKSTGKTIKATVQKNVIKGGRQGMFVCSHAGKTKMGKFTVKSNKAYSKAGKKRAIVNSKAGASKFKTSKNKTYKWTTKAAKAENTKSLELFTSSSSALKAAAVSL